MVDLRLILAAGCAKDHCRNVMDLPRDLFGPPVEVTTVTLSPRFIEEFPGYARCGRGNLPDPNPRLYSWLLELSPGHAASSAARPWAWPSTMLGNSRWCRAANLRPRSTPTPRRKLSLCISSNAPSVANADVNRLRDDAVAFVLDALSLAQEPEAALALEPEAQSRADPVLSQPRAASGARPTG
jgi:hypothetical protein